MIDQPPPPHPQCSDRGSRKASKRFPCSAQRHDGRPTTIKAHPLWLIGGEGEGPPRGTVVYSPAFPCPSSPPTRSSSRTLLRLRHERPSRSVSYQAAWSLLSYCGYRIPSSHVPVLTAATPLFPSLPHTRPTKAAMHRPRAAPPFKQPCELATLTLPRQGRPRYEVGKRGSRISRG